MKNRLLLSALVAIALAFLVRAPARAGCSSYPFPLSNGTTADANQVMGNFNNVLSCAQNVDFSQIGAAGIYASNIKATNLSQGTFGGTGPYQIGPFATSVVSWTIAAQSGQTVDIEDVTLNALKVFAIDKSGIAYFLPSATQSVPSVVAAGDAVFQEGVSTGRIVFGGATTSCDVDFGITTSAVLTSTCAFKAPTLATTTTGQPITSGKIGFTAVIGSQASPIGATFPPVRVPGNSIYEFGGTVNAVSITESDVDCGTANSGTTTWTLGNGLTAISQVSTGHANQAQSTTLSLPAVFTVTVSGGTLAANCTVEISGFQEVQ